MMVSAGNISIYKKFNNFKFKLGMPELKSSSDVAYVQNNLCLNLNEQEATKKFEKEIYDSLNSTWTTINH